MVKLRNLQPVEVKKEGLPSCFLCPISLEVMRSPVSLSTGVTYDRSSIQRWLESGHQTCPATRLPLPPFSDGAAQHQLVPNLTLRRLIDLWSSGHALHISQSSPPPEPSVPSPDILHDLLGLSTRSGAEDLVPLLRRLSALFSSASGEEDERNRIAAAPEFASAMVSYLVRSDAALEVVELIVSVLASVLRSRCGIADGRRYRELVAAALQAELDASIAAILAVMKKTNGLSKASRIDAATILELILSTSSVGVECKTSVSEKHALFPELVHLIGAAADEGVDPASADAGFRCLLAALSAEPRRARARMVQVGVVRATVQALAATEAVPPEVAERALLVLEAAAGCAVGRAAVCEIAAECVPAVMARMMKVGNEGREAAVAVLWSACVAAGDWRAREAALRERDGPAKLLVVMQGGCSPAATRMAGELLRVFRADGMSCSAGYDTKTIHIMPF